MANSLPHITAAIFWPLVSNRPGSRTYQKTTEPPAEMTAERIIILALIASGFNTYSEIRAAMIAIRRKINYNTLSQNFTFLESKGLIKRMKLPGKSNELKRTAVYCTAEGYDHLQKVEKLLSKKSLEKLPREKRGYKAWEY